MLMYQLIGTRSLITNPQRELNLHKQVFTSQHLLFQLFMNFRIKKMSCFTLGKMLWTLIWTLLLTTFYICFYSAMHQQSRTKSQYCHINNSLAILQFLHWHSITPRAYSIYIWIGLIFQGWQFHSCYSSKISLWWAHSSCF